MKEKVHNADLRSTGGPQRVQAVERAFVLLDALVKFQGSASAGDLKQASGLAGPTVSRKLARRSGTPMSSPDFPKHSGQLTRRLGHPKSPGRRRTGRTVSEPRN